MAKDLFDIFIAYHGSSTPDGSLNKALSLYFYLKEKGWKPYLFFACDGNGKFTSTPTIVMRSRAFLLVANGSISADKNGKLNSTFLNDEIAAFYIKMDTLKNEDSDYRARFKAYTYGGLDGYKLTYLNGVFAGVPVFEEKDEQKSFEEVNDWLTKTLKTSILKEEHSFEQKTPERTHNGFEIFYADEPLEILQKNNHAQDEIYDFPYDMTEDYLLLLKQFFHEYVDDKCSPDIISYLLHVGSISDEFSRFFFTIAINDDKAKQGLRKLFDLAKSNEEDNFIFLNYFYFANSVTKLFLDINGDYTSNLSGHNEKKMRLITLHRPKSAGVNISFSWGRILYSDLMKIHYCDVEFTDCLGKRTTFRDKYLLFDANRFYENLPSEAPNKCGVGLFLFTDDYHLVMQKRAGHESVIYFQDMYSYSAAGTVDTVSDFDKVKDVNSTSSPTSESFLATNAITRECFEELKIPLEDENPFLFSMGYDFDNFYFEFTYVAFSSLSCDEIQRNAYKAADGIGREINYLYFLDLIPLFDEEQDVDPKVVNLLKDIRHFEPAFYENIKEVFLTSSKFKKYICKGLKNPENFTRNKIKNIMK